MNISYEEAMRRIDEYEKADLNRYIEGIKACGFDHEKTMQKIEIYEKKLRYRCCRETSFPFDIYLYRGEGKIIVVPVTKSMFWYRCELAAYCCLNDTENAIDIGKTVSEVFDYLKKSPVDTRTVEECAADDYIQKYTTCKTFKSFAKKYSLCLAILNEDGTYIISASERLKNYNGYGGLDDPNDPFRFKLPKEASDEEIGNAVIAALDRSDELERAIKPDPYPPVEVELLSDQKIKISPPRDRHFTDCGDGGAAEIYKLYEYSASEGADPAARLFLCIAAELDCDMTEDNIRTVWEKLYGKGENFEVADTSCGIFTLRADMRNSKVRKVSYLLRIDENELLECTLEFDYPDKRKKTEEKLLKMFEKFASDCRIVP